MILVIVSSCTEPIPRKPVSYHSTTVLNESVKLNRALNAIEEKLIETYIEKDSLHTYNYSPEGFWYAYISQNNLASYTPKEGDEIEFEHQITSLNNQVLYSKDQLGKAVYLTDKQEIITGLQKGLKIMKEGEEVQFLFPSFNAYGKIGNGDKIGINQPLIYKVKLIKINKN